MRDIRPERVLPFEQRDVIAYSVLLAESFRRWLGQELIKINNAPLPLEGGGQGGGDGAKRHISRHPHPPFGHLPPSRGKEEIAYTLYHAPFVLVSHDARPDPVFRYANLRAQELWGYDWDRFTRLSSRLSAEPVAQEERKRLLDRAARDGYVDDYAGIRIAGDGRRFSIRDTVLWNVVDEAGALHGQAAMFTQWQWL